MMTLPMFPMFPRGCRQFKNIGLLASVSVIPAKAGTQNPVAGKYAFAANGLWIPAFAGMTVNMTTLPSPSIVNLRNSGCNKPSQKSRSGAVIVCRMACRITCQDRRWPLRGRLRNLGSKGPGRTRGPAIQAASVPRGEIGGSAGAVDQIDAVFAPRVSPLVAYQPAHRPFDAHFHDVHFYWELHTRRSQSEG